MSRRRRNASAPRRQAPSLQPATQQRDYGFQDWINLYQANLASQWPGFQMTWGGKDPAEPIGPNFADYVVGGMQSNGIVWSLEQKRIQIFSQVRYQFQGFNNGRPGKLFPKPNLALVERPWMGGTTSDLNARMLVDADLAGNSFLVAPDGDEVVRLRPDWVEIVLKPRMLPLGPDSESVQVGFKQIGILYYEGGMYAGAKPAVFLPGEYSHFAPIPDPLATYRGMSWLTPVIREIQADTQATKHKLKFFENAATPNLAVSLPKEITPAQFEAFVEKMDARHRGADHAYETLYTGGGADVTVVGANMHQLDFKVTQGAGETRLAAAAGIHPVIVGLSEGMQGSSLNSGNYNAAKRSTVDTTFRHLWQNAAGSLEQLVTPPDAVSRLWYDARDVPFLHEDQKDAADIQQLKATTITMYVREGFTPESAIAAVDADDRTLLVHTGLVSVQLQPPGALQPQGGSAGPKAAAVRSSRAGRASAVRKFDPAQKRDGHGRWSKIGAALHAIAEAAKVPVIGHEVFGGEDDSSHSHGIVAAHPGGDFTLALHDKDTGTHPVMNIPDGDAREELRQAFEDVIVAHDRRPSAAGSIETEDGSWRITYNADGATLHANLDDDAPLEKVRLSHADVKTIESALADIAGRADSADEPGYTAPLAPNERMLRNKKRFSDPDAEFGAVGAIVETPDGQRIRLGVIAQDDDGMKNWTGGRGKTTVDLDGADAAKVAEVLERFDADGKRRQKIYDKHVDAATAREDAGEDVDWDQVDAAIKAEIGPSITGDDRIASWEADYAVERIETPWGTLRLTDVGMDDEANAHERHVRMEIWPAGMTEAEYEAGQSNDGGPSWAWPGASGRYQKPDPSLLSKDVRALVKLLRSTFETS